MFICYFFDINLRREIYKEDPFEEALICLVYCPEMFYLQAHQKRAHKYVAFPHRNTLDDMA